MPVYLMRSGDAVKIGFSKSPWLRLSKARSDSPLPVDLIALIEGDEGVEAKLHEQFGHLRLHGEWFRWTDDLAQLAKQNPATKPARKRRRARGTSAPSINREAIQRAIDLCGGQVRLGKFIGVPQQTVSAWLTEAKLPLKAEHAIAIDEATRGEVTKEELRPDLWSAQESPP